jgi:hypothetical protein
MSLPPHEATWFCEICCKSLEPSARAPFNQPGNFVRARPFQSTLLPHTKDKGTHTLLLPFWAWYPLMRPHGLDMAIRWYHRRSEWSQDHNGHYFSSWKDLTVKKSASKSSAVSAQEWGILYWPACWVAYKRKPGRPQSPVCSQGSTPPHPSWTQPELHHLDTVCWISKFPIVNKCHFPWAHPDQQGRAHFHQSGKLEHAPFKWARPSQVNAPLSSERAPFHQSDKLERAPFQVNAPLSINQANLSVPFSKGRSLSFPSNSESRT